MLEERRAELGRGKEERCCRDPVLHPSFSGCVTVNKLMSVSGIHQISAIMEAVPWGCWEDGTWECQLITCP